MDNGQGDPINLQEGAIGKFTDIMINTESETVIVTVVASDDINTIGRVYTLEYDNAFRNFARNALKNQIRRLARQGYPEIETLDA